MSIRLEDLKAIFVEQSGLFTEEEFTRTVDRASALRQPLDRLLLERGFVSPRYYLDLLGHFFNFPTTELKIADIDVSVLPRIPESVARKNLVVAFRQDATGVHVAVADPRLANIKEGLEEIVHSPVVLHIATERAIRRTLLLYHGGINEMLAQVSAQIIQGKAPKTPTTTIASIVTFVDTLIEAATLLGASDIHIEPYEQDVIIRFRVDGALKTVTTIPQSFHASLVARLKVLANLKMDEHRLPQDGRFSSAMQDQLVDLRISIVPSFWGEKIVLRVLQKDAGLLDLTSLGLAESELQLVKSYLRRPYGMILVCGPTGSGKTSTLYACLEEIGMEKIDVVNISTVEDPIEYSMPRITQIPIKPEIDLTFSSGLRALLRQDPDIIMVGEIRDRETADIAVRSSLTGRLLLSSLHTNDALGAIPRLLDMGVEPYLLGSTLSLVIAQRLARKLCTHCRQSYKPNQATLETLKKFYNLPVAIQILQKGGVLGKEKNPLDGIRFFRAQGCAQCDHDGYQGRTGLFEVLEVTPEMRQAISMGKDTMTLRSLAEKNGMKTLSVDGLSKVILGLTDLDEVMRVTL